MAARRNGSLKPTGIKRRGPARVDRVVGALISYFCNIRYKLQVKRKIVSLYNIRGDTSNWTAPLASKSAANLSFCQSRHQRHPAPLEAYMSSR